MQKTSSMGEGEGIAAGEGKSDPLARVGGTQQYGGDGKRGEKRREINE